MPAFKVLYIEEFDRNDTIPGNTDHRIAVLYDESSERFYYYGTRNRESNKKQKYIEYSGSYSYEAFHNFDAFLKYILDGNKSLITTELYDIYIDENEYDWLSFSKIKSKFNNRALLSAYDRHSNTGDYLAGLLLLLVSS